MNSPASLKPIGELQYVNRNAQFNKNNYHRIWIYYTYIYAITHQVVIVNIINHHTKLFLRFFPSQIPMRYTFNPGMLITSTATGPQRSTTPNSTAIVIYWKCVIRL